MEFGAAESDLNLGAASAGSRDDDDVAAELELDAESDVKMEETDAEDMDVSSRVGDLAETESALQNQDKVLPAI